KEPDDFGDKRKNDFEPYWQDEKVCPTCGTKDYNFCVKERPMSLHKLYSFVLVASVAGFATVGTLNVQIKEYEVPTPRSRPHDPAMAPDGSLWYTGQGANKLGRLDPKTGEFKEYPLKTRDSGPHGLVAD